MDMTIADRLKMHENRFRKLELEYAMLRQLQFAQLRTLERVAPGSGDTVLEILQQARTKARADRLADEELVLHNLINQLQQGFALPAND